MRLTTSQAKWLALAQVCTRRDGPGEWLRLWQLGARTDREPTALMRLGLVEKRTDEMGYWYRLTDAGCAHDCGGWKFSERTGHYEEPE